MIDKVLPTLVAVDRENGPSVAQAYATRGAARVQTGARAAGVDDLQRAVDIFGRAQVAPTFEAGAEWELAKAVAPTDLTRARKLATDAADRFAHATRPDAAAEITAWLAAHPR